VRLSVGRKEAALFVLARRAISTSNSTVAVRFISTRTVNNVLQTNGTDKKYLYLDHLGSVDAITDGIGKVTHSMSFDAWGGWVLVEKNENQNIKSLHESDSSRWYRNLNGDHLVCHLSVTDEICGGVYEVFSKQQDGSFLHDEIFCME